MMRIYPDLPILIVDDEENFLYSLNFFLKSEGITNVVTTCKSSQVPDMLRQQNFSLILLDVMMPGLNGIDLLKIIKNDFPQIPVVMITAINVVENIVESMKAGAYDYIVKPIDEQRLILIIRHALELYQLRCENLLVKEQFISKEYQKHPAFNKLITNNDQMKSIFKYAEAISRTPMPVLVTGETGTGKELLAEAIHILSERKGDLIKLNIAGEDDSFITDTLFGHGKGSFTGAIEKRKGLIEQADEGSLFLDEIGDLNLQSQVKLLRLLQENKYYSIGSDQEKAANTRFIFATNKNLARLVQDNKFRNDLYYRLKFHLIHIPPLRDRLDDIPLLVDFFVNKTAQMLGKKVPDYDRSLITMLQNYDYPGNLRELEAILFDVVSSNTSGTIDKDKIANKLTFHSSQEIPGEGSSQILPLNTLGDNKSFPKLKETEEFLINEALQRTMGNQTEAAKLLGISRKALNNRLLRKKNKEPDSE